MDVADACRARRHQGGRGDRRLHRTPRRGAEFYAHMDAANVDLKAFTEEFYEKVTCAAELAAVLDTLEYLRTRPTSGSRSRRC